VQLLLPGSAPLAKSVSLSEHLIQPGTAGGHIDESTGPTSGARERLPEEEKARTSPDRRDDKSVDPWISAPPESNR